jgi:AsmA protein
MSKTVKFITVFLVVIITIIVMIPVLISSDDIVNKLSKNVTKSTGRTLVIGGDKSFSVFPSLSLELQDVRLSNMDSGSKADMITMKSLELHIPWLSIFSGELIIERFVIEQPNILLETDKEGRNNWQLLTSTANNLAPKEASVPEINQPSLPENVDLSLGQIKIIGGQLTLIDHRSDSKTQVEQLNISLMLPSLRKALALNGQLNFMGEAFTFDANIETPAKLINNQLVNIDLALTSSLFNIKYTGELIDSGNTIKGHLALDTESVKNILSWQKQTLTAKDNTFNELSFNTDITFSNNTLNLNKLNAKLDELAFTGHSSLILASPLQVNLAIDLGVLDLNPYLTEVAQPTDIKNQDNTEQQSKAIVWDKTPLDLSALKQVDANIKLSASQLLFREITLNENQLSLLLKEGNALLTLEKFNAYQGKGIGVVKLTTAKKPYKLQSQFELKDIQANPLLKDAVGFDKLLGKGLVNWNISTQGLSQHDFIHALDGKIGLNLSDGAVKGVNLAALARSAEGLLSGDMSKVSLDHNFDDAQATDFASLMANFNFTKGVGNTTDLALVNPFIRVNGQGVLDLANTDIDFKIQTKLIASADGQQASNQKSGVTIPIKITGPFHNTKIKADISSVTLDTIKEKLTDKLKGFFN